MRGNTLLGRLGSGLACIWVGSVCLGWLPDTWLIIAQAWWWVAASLLILLLTAFVPRKWAMLEPAWGACGLSLSVFAWIPRMPGSLLWLLQTLVWVWAGTALVERFGWKVLQQAVCWIAWLEVVILIAQWCGWHVYPSVGLSGSVGRRAVLGTLFGFASLWSPRWRAWFFAGMSGLTGSWTGVIIPLFRLLPLAWWVPMTWTMPLTLLLLTHHWWMERFLLRWQVWSHALSLWIQHPWTGWGLEALPRGFAEASIVGTISIIRDFHNTWLDTLIRGGSLGMLVLLSLLLWAGLRSWRTKTLWTFGMALWVMTWQSVGSQPVLICFALIWLLSLCNARRLNAHPV